MNDSLVACNIVKQNEQLLHQQFKIKIKTVTSSYIQYIVSVLLKKNEKKIMSTSQAPDVINFISPT